MTDRDETVAEALARVVAETLPRLREVPDAAAGKSPAPGVWSPKQVIGHLIDSAANNHARFVRAQLEDGLVFAGYEQERWVEAQGYATARWSDLLELWSAYNRHLARVVARTPGEVLRRPRAEHNLDQIAWRPVPRRTPVTLESFVADYLGHLEHHLRQVFARLGVPAPAAIGEDGAAEGR